MTAAFCSGLSMTKVHPASLAVCRSMVPMISPRARSGKPGYSRTSWRSCAAGSERSLSALVLSRAICAAMWTTPCPEKGRLGAARLDRHRLQQDVVAEVVETVEEVADVALPRLLVQERLPELAE